jgi:hypothetical protein
MTGDWRQRGGDAAAPVQLPPMDLNKEHFFELMSVDFQDGVQETYEGKTKTVNKIKMVFKEAGKDKDYHRVWMNFNEYYTEKSNLMKFLLAASGKPFVAGIHVTLGDFLQDHHKIHVMLKARFNAQTGLPSGYYDFIPASIKPATESQGGVSGVTLVDLMTIAKGCKSAGDVFALAYGKVPANIIQEFVAADKRGEIKYPIA